jgi:hypothetical protein
MLFFCTSLNIFLSDAHFCEYAIVSLDNAIEFNIRRYQALAAIMTAIMDIQGGNIGSLSTPISQ